MNALYRKGMQCVFLHIMPTIAVTSPPWSRAHLNHKTMYVQWHFYVRFISLVEAKSEKVTMTLY